MNRSILIAALALLTAACAVNPSQGEIDIAMARYEDPQEISDLQSAADNGESWAQLRLGVAYELGVDVDKNIPTAIEWYKKAANQIQMKGGTGPNSALIDENAEESGYFNQKGDALIAHHQLANIYLEGNEVEKNLVLAYLLEKFVANHTKGKNIFYCCWSSGGRYISGQAISDTLRHIEAEMSEQQRKEAKARIATWSIKDGLH